MSTFNLNKPTPLHLVAYKAKIEKNRGLHINFSVSEPLLADAAAVKTLNCWTLVVVQTFCEVWVSRRINKKCFKLWTHGLSREFSKSGNWNRTSNRHLLKHVTHQKKRQKLVVFVLSGKNHAHLQCTNVCGKRSLLAHSMKVPHNLGVLLIDHEV